MEKKLLLIIQLVGINKALLKEEAIFGKGFIYKKLLLQGAMLQQNIRGSKKYKEDNVVLLLINQ